ncbi:MAG: DNRLRE domain-containing protein, partial [Anaerolineales bacterium]|nr:DNRLRE domain-containing protein [Anaerolineales bacterium]
MQLNRNRLRWLWGGLGLMVTAVSCFFVGSQHQPIATALPAVDPVRRINIEEYSNDPDEEWAKTSIIWFGKAEYPGQGRNYVDVRVAYTQSNFLVQFLVIDYYLWLDTDPQPDDDLTQYDALALYLDTAYDRASTPQSDDYQFLVGQFNGVDYNPYQRDARGNGTSWNAAWEGTGWRSPVGLDYSTGGPNNNGGNIDYGWTAVFVIPWGDLGMSGPPAEGTRWGFGTRLYDRDDQPPAGAIPTESWPETFQPDNPSTWAELHFGADAYDPGAGTAQGTTLIRAASPTDNTVEDAWMGGGGLCASGHEGGTEVNHGDDPDLFTGNEIRPTHFPCYNKSFLRFDLGDIPVGKRILSAELTLHLDGNAGETPDLAKPSWVSLFSIKDPWEEMTIHWNNAPLAYENIDATWVYPYSGDRDHPVPPGDPYTWDATKAVAEAYENG